MCLMSVIIRCFGFVDFVSAGDFVHFGITGWVGRFEEADRELALFQIMRFRPTKSFGANKIASNAQIGVGHLQSTSPRNKSKRLKEGKNEKENY